MRECILRTDDHLPRAAPRAQRLGNSAGRKNLHGAETEATVKRRKMATFEAYNEELFERLQELRKRIADERGVPAFVVFSDSTLHDMCRRFPTTGPELLEVTGVGEQKLRLYGPRFIAVVERFLTDNPQCAPVRFVPPPRQADTPGAQRGNP